VRGLVFCGFGYVTVAGDIRAHLRENELRQGKIDPFVFFVSIAAKPGEVRV
jgi:hypothetical protein